MIKNFYVKKNLKIVKNKIDKKFKKYFISKSNS